MYIIYLKTDRTSGARRDRRLPGRWAGRARGALTNNVCIIIISSSSSSMFVIMLNSLIILLLLLLLCIYIYICITPYILLLLN